MIWLALIRRFEDKDALPLAEFTDNRALDSLKSSIILVTGAAGFLGRAVVGLLDAHAGTVIGVGGRVDGDLTEFKTWARLPDDVTNVVHLAAVLPPAPDKAFAVNPAMCGHLARRASGWSHLRSIVLASSISVYDPGAEEFSEDSPVRPPTAYGRSKLESERIVEAIPVRSVALRFSSIYGSGQEPHTVLPTFVRRALDGVPLSVYGDGSRTQDFVHVEDAARAVALALASEASGAVNIGSGFGVSMVELARTVVRIFGGRVELDPGRKETAPSVRVCVDRARALLGFSPMFDLERGLSQYREALDLQR